MEIIEEEQHRLLRCYCGEKVANLREECRLICDRTHRATLGEGGGSAGQAPSDA